MRATWIILGAMLAIPPLTRADEKDDLAKQTRQILTTHCYRCHGQNGAKEGGFDWVTDLKKLVGTKVVAGDPAKSRLYKRINPDLIGDMPQDELTKPTAAEIETIRKWIAAGAPEPPAEKAQARAFVALKDELENMQKYLRKANRDDRKSIRFFSLRHLYNLPPETVRDQDLRIYRAALSKLINSLSRKKEIVVPESADAAGTLFAVNISRLDWDRRDLWNEILKVNPYGLTHEQYPDVADMRDVAEDVYTLSATKVPVLRADWFIAIASRPPLYHTLLQLPTNAKDLEKELGVDVAEDFRTGKLKRAGFSASGVSAHNRMVERHDSPQGAYWKSYDFKNGAGKGNLFVFPLGPEFANNPFPRNAFQHAGGEIIFNLPNGLQGYLLVNAKDERIDEGPIEVVSDGKKISGTPAVVTGLSCMSCHQHGMISFTDEIRSSQILGGDARDLVKRLYPEKAEMDKDIERDRKRFVAALDESMRPFLTDGDAKRPVEDFPEPISAIARWYLQQELTLEAAAAELGLKDPSELKAAVNANSRLQQVGLYPLTRGQTIKREVWEDRSALNSPFQEAARVLKLGTPFNPL